MRFKGQRTDEKKITHPKKELDFDKYSKDAVTFEDFIVAIGIDYYKYEKILESLMIIPKIQFILSFLKVILKMV
jgi:hypothetical protein